MSHVPILVFIFGLLCLAIPSRAAIHYLMAGTYDHPGCIITLAFDDIALTLNMTKNTTIGYYEPTGWMTFDHEKKNIYGASNKSWTAYAVNNATDITHYASIPLTGDSRAILTNSSTRAIFVLAAKKPPFAVYGVPFFDYAFYGSVCNVTAGGKMDSNIQDYFYSNVSSIHGMVFDPPEEYLYSADLTGNKIWTHKKDMNTGKLTLVSSIDAPAQGDKPRWVEMHPSGNYLYVIMEEGNRLAVYVIDEMTHMPVFTQVIHSLSPPGFPATSYQGDVTYLSHSAKYLFASTRSRTTNHTGYISAFALSPTGAIERRLAITPTSSTGGYSNAIAPADFSDEWFALSDSQLGFVEIYAWREGWMGSVAKFQLPAPAGHFAMNAIWYS